MDEEVKAAEQSDGELAAPAEGTQDETAFTEGAEETEPANPSAEESGQEAHETAHGTEESESKAQKDQHRTGPDEAQKDKRLRRDARIREEAYRQAVLDATGGVNPYTGEEMRDKLDIEEYLAMRKIEQSGGDPVADYRTTLKTQAREQAKAAETADKQQADLDGFAEKHPDIDVSKLLHDGKFARFAGKRLGHESLADVYEDYLSFTSEMDVKAEARADAKAKNALAKAKASPGSLTGEDVPAVSYANMSDEDFDRKLEAVLRGREKI